MKCPNILIRAHNNFERIYSIYLAIVRHNVVRKMNICFRWETSRYANWISRAVKQFFEHRRNVNPFLHLFRCLFKPFTWDKRTSGRFEVAILSDVNLYINWKRKKTSTTQKIKNEKNKSPKKVKFNRVFQVSVF
jgi:hypothetical protein